MIDPIFWLGLSILLVAVSLTAVLVVAIPAFQELARAARSAEKLFDTLSREFPPTLEAIRLTSLEITELTDDMSEGVQNVGQVAQQVNKGVSGVAGQAKQAGSTTRSVFVGVKAAWKTFNQGRQEPGSPEMGQLPAGAGSAIEIEGDREEFYLERDGVEEEPMPDHLRKGDARYDQVDVEADVPPSQPPKKVRSLREEDISR